MIPEEVTTRLAELESEKLRLLEKRSTLDPWSAEWDRSRVRYQQIEYQMRVLATHGAARYAR